MVRNVDLYFDFLSPYAWLALNQAGECAVRNDIEWTVRPIVYGVLLNVHELIGPVESAAKRRYTFLDVARRAQQLGLRFAGPPAHPFRSLRALRAMWIHRQSERALDLAVAMANAAWCEGRDLTDVAVLAEVIGSQGLDATQLVEQIENVAVKEGLKTETGGAISRGVFGVPTFVFAGELFWGHDRLADLERRLAGEPFTMAAAAEAMIERPAGVERQRR